MNDFYAGQVVEYNDPHESLFAFVHWMLMSRYGLFSSTGGNYTEEVFAGFSCPEGYDLVATDHQIACAYRKKAACLAGSVNEAGAFVCSDWDYPPCPPGMSASSIAGAPKNWCYPAGSHYVGDEAPPVDWSALGHGCPMGYYFAPLEGVCRPIPPPPPGPRHVIGGGDGGLSFEDAWAHAEQKAVIGQQSGPDPIDKIRSELSNAGAGIVAACAPDSMSVVIKAAIQNGRAVGVSVYTTPASGAVSACVARHVRALKFSVSGYMDAITATF
jgi:hypothetical protein